MPAELSHGLCARLTPQHWMVDIALGNGTYFSTASMSGFQARRFPLRPLSLSRLRNELLPCVLIS
jgi:hypothetical protein